ncbi:MAG TPA: 2-oxoglutarate dehydrogenase complex dihydrolipoyllysine-residue succinyltransferase [Candidatus Binatia bacterium]|nr:2-oxoglutarate dehydrogenase complex dihydrolipoyllysine-residue succinyltransferase [Candidatus Binatia bacterium]
MRIEIKVPNVGESISQVEVGEWLKRRGDTVSKDETLLLLETDKATVEIRTPESGTLVDVLKNNGEGAAIGEVIAYVETSGDGAAVPAPDQEQASAHGEMPSETEPVVETPAPPDMQPGAPAAAQLPPEDDLALAGAPSARDVEVVGTKEAAAQETQDAEPLESSETPQDEPPESEPSQTSILDRGARKQGLDGRREETKPMSLLRRRIAERLVAAQQNAALLTTFNEIDMSTVIRLREEHGEQFRASQGAKLGFMSFFVKAAVSALQTLAEVNAEIRGTDIVYHRYYDIGVAVGGGKGLVVPVLRNADRMSFADIERAIADFAARAGTNQLKPDELKGGTFTITNGGVYGSLLSTPLVNPPQSAILGLHAVQERPVARKGRVVVRPMMYVALTYDHRIIDGREAVLFLKQIKTLIEEPARLLLQF